jgi:LDH2 family malate/lactate/ureidoglycolate dehydrogenase
VKTIHGAPAAEGFSEILFPGEPEARLQRTRERGGIPYAQAEKSLLEKVAIDYDVMGLTFRQEPISG